MDDEDIESAMTTVMRAITAIGERLDRDLIERDGLLQRLDGALDRIAALDRRVEELSDMLASMRKLH